MFADTLPVEAPPVLGAVRDVLAALVADFDPAALTAESAVEVTEAFAAVERLAHAGKVLAAGRAQEADLIRLRGQRSAARWLATVSGCSKTEADGLLVAATQLSSLPATATAVRAGRLSGDQTRAVCDGAATEPRAEAELLVVAQRESLFGLRRAVDGVKAATESSAEDEMRNRRAHARRRLTCSTRGGEAFAIGGSGGVGDGVTILRALRQQHERLFREASARSERVSYEALMFDALVAMARDSLGEGDDAGEVASDGVRTRGRVGRPAGAAVKTILRIDYPAVMRGHTVEGEVCEIAGLGPLPVSAVREILAGGDVFLSAVLTKAERVVGVVNLGRRPNALQTTALEWLHPTCAVAGCDNTILQWDHEVDWADTHQTVLEDLDGLCGPDHRLKTNDGFRLEPGTGKRRFLPPGHADHPRPRARGRRRSPPTAA